MVSFSVGNHSGTRCQHVFNGGAAVLLASSSPFFSYLCALFYWRRPKRQVDRTDGFNTTILFYCPGCWVQMVIDLGGCHVLFYGDVYLIYDDAIIESTHPAPDSPGSNYQQKKQRFSDGKTSHLTNSSIQVFDHLTMTVPPPPRHTA